MRRCRTLYIVAVAKSSERATVLAGRRIAKTPESPIRLKYLDICLQLFEERSLRFFDLLCSSRRTNLVVAIIRIPNVRYTTSSRNDVGSEYYIFGSIYRHHCGNVGPGRNSGSIRR
jgi:hypothetical protein